MTFVSFSFLAFFPVVTTAYFLSPQRFRWFLLLAGSCVFYMAFVPAYILILFALIAVDYAVALRIEASVGARRQHYLLVSIVSLVGILFIFKYFNFFNANLALLAEFLHWNYSVGLLALALPLGLSFHTFQSLSYVIEVYRGRQKAERRLGIYALYVMFYPQLVAGPIERPQHLLHQFYENRAFEYERVKDGLIRMAWGFFKKMVVADRLAIVVNHVFAEPHAFDGLPLLIAAVFFALEIYFDFSGYCDIGLGAAKVMGFTLVENFDRPFMAKSIAEFWRRWHISLSSWFRDYFYYPLILGGTVTPLKLYAAVFATFLVTGFWHGANWTFGVMGALHGSYIIIGSVTAKQRAALSNFIGLSKAPKLKSFLQQLTVFALVTFAFIFFRSPDVQTAAYIVSHLGAGLQKLQSPADILAVLSTTGLSVKGLAFAALLALLVLFCEYLGKEQGVFALLKQQPVYVRWGIYWFVGFMILLFNVSTTSQFIYFRF